MKTRPISDSTQHTARVGQVRHVVRAIAVICGGLTMGCHSTHAATPVGPQAVRAVSDVEWTPLNTARGDASPRAATLWGDRASEGPSGFLVRFADGFSSPPHIHNVTYRAVVLSGEVHNDDASAEPMWMSPGSFWTQPNSLAHITSSRGESVAYVEIDNGPYWVRPADQAQNVTEKPVNVDVSNLVWTRAPAQGTELVRLWGAPDDAGGGLFVRVNAGAHARLQATQPVRAVVIHGEPQMSDGSTSATVGPGSLATSTDLEVACPSVESCVVYVRTATGLTISDPDSGSTD